MCGDIEEYLQKKVYDKYQFQNFYKLRSLPNLEIALKNQIEKEIIPINSDSKYLEKCLKWFESILEVEKKHNYRIKFIKKEQRQKLKIKLLQLLETDSRILLQEKLAKYCSLNFSLERLDILLQNFINFFEGKITVFFLKKKQTTMKICCCILL